MIIINQIIDDVFEVSSEGRPFRTVDNNGLCRFINDALKLDLVYPTDTDEKLDRALEVLNKMKEEVEKKIQNIYDGKNE